MITFIFGGGRHEAEAEALIEYYGSKIKKIKQTEIITVQTREKQPARMQEEESRKIIAALRPGDYLIVFDERGEEADSEAYAEVIRKAEESHRRIVIVVGGAYGTTDDLRQKANKIIAFSRMIFPHQLSRTMALEQTYRALSIIRGSKYHHG